MNTVHPMELFLLSIALFLYAFANFRLTRVLCCSAKATQFMEALAHVGCMTLAELLLCFLLSQEQSILVVFVFVLVCGFFILFLYDRSPQRNLRTLLKLFGCDWLLIAIWILADGGYENTDDVFLFLTLCGAKLVLTLLTESHYRQQEKEKYSHQLELYHRQMDLMEQSQAQIRFLRHDMKNHLLHMNQLLLEQDNERLNAYLQTTATHFSVVNEFVRSGNRDIDSLLNYKLLTAEQLGTEIITDIAIPPDLKISSFDLNVILGNLLDNAIEALQSSEERRLCISLRYDADVLSIHLQNTCTQKPPAFSVKGNGHGLGLHSVRHTLEHYHGQLKTDYQNHVFTASAILYLF